MTIIRTWHGRTRLADADSYETFLRMRAAPDYLRTPGLMRAIFTRRNDEEAAHFLLITMWRDMQSVREFAGDDPAKAKYYEEDEAYLMEKEDCSLNHQLFYDSASQGG